MDETILLDAYVFISYDIADSVEVDELRLALENVGIMVCPDIPSNWSQDDRTTETKGAISDSTVALLCLSEARLARTKSFQHLESVLLVTSLRERQDGQPWLIPVRFDDCQVPDIDLGAGRLLSKMDAIKLFGSDKDVNLAELVRIVQSIVSQAKRRYARDGLRRKIQDPPGLLLRFYVPSGRLYAAETTRLVSMFRDWLSGGRQISVRYGMHQTQAGTVHEFYADHYKDMVDLRVEFRDFAGFLELCATNPEKAAKQLAQTGLSPAASADVVARYGREMRRLSIDLQYEREQRILTIRRNLDSELLDTATHPEQVRHLVEARIPMPTALSPMSPLAYSAQPMGIPLALTINQQVINAVESQIIQNVEGTINLGPTAKELFDLIARFGGHEVAALRVAAQELEDPGTRPPDRLRAGERLKAFIWQLGTSVQAATISMLQSYIEKKMHIT